MLRNQESITWFIAITLSIVITFSPGVLAQNDHMHDEAPISGDQSIGKIHFNANCSAEVQDDLNRAIGMLHHMMYMIARDSFEQIVEADPNCAMAYWGVATTLFQPIWGTRPSDEDLQYGWEYISNAMGLAGTEREQLFIESTAGFFREPGSADFRTRIDRWVSGVEKAYETYPDDADIASFYALTKMTQAQFTDNRGPLYDEAESTLWKVFEQNPEHPGAIHYMIHTTDVDGRAENALEVVQAYAGIAPQVPHALHMPSHIYVRLGDWPQVIDWNRQSAEAALKHPLNGAESHHYIHAIDYLVYAYLQRGEDEKAEMIYRNALTKDSHQQSFVSAFHFAAIPARLAVEQRDWERALNLEPRTPDYLPWDASPWAEAITWLAKGLGAAHLADLETAKQSEQRLAELREIARERGDDNMVIYIDTERHILSGRIAYAEGDHEKAIELTRKAVELENSVEKHPVTPGALQPPREALGDLYMDLNRPEEALKAYDSSNDIWPGRLNTLMGAALAAKMTGEKQLARNYFGKLMKSNLPDDLDPEPAGTAHRDF
jgi:tetratricopeptide (TPR) repeat protein